MEDSNKAEDAKTAFGGTSAELGHMLGWDTNRAWANNVQIFKNPDHVIFVFREIIEVEAMESADAETGEKANIGKNVSSVVMPVKVAQSFAQVLQKLFADAPES